jgi:hypothetical protein
MASVFAFSAGSADLDGWLAEGVGDAFGSLSVESSELHADAATRAAATNNRGAERTRFRSRSGRRSGRASGATVPPRTSFVCVFTCCCGACCNTPSAHQPPQVVGPASHVTQGSSNATARYGHSARPTSPKPAQSRTTGVAERHSSRPSHPTRWAIGAREFAESSGMSIHRHTGLHAHREVGSLSRTRSVKNSPSGRSRYNRRGAAQDESPELLERERPPDSSFRPGSSRPRPAAS